MAYLIRTRDPKGLPDVEARFMRRLDPHRSPDLEFEMEGPLAGVGQHIFTMPIEDIRT